MAARAAGVEGAAQVQIRARPTALDHLKEAVTVTADTEKVGVETLE
jgi:hypothetical protein